MLFICIIWIGYGFLFFMFLIINILTVVAVLVIYEWCECMKNSKKKIITIIIELIILNLKMIKNKK